MTKPDESAFDRILAQCLDQIDQGAASAEQCLAQHPEHAEGLAPLLRTAALLRAAPDVAPSPAFQSTASVRLLNVITARSPAPKTALPAPAPSRPRRWRLPLLGRLAAAVVVASLFLAGAAYAARDSLPDSPLYPVKTTVARVQVLVSPGDARRLRVFAGQMDQRAIEIGAMARQGRSERVRAVSVDYLRMLQEVERLSARLPAARGESRVLLLLVRERLLAQQAIFQRAINSAPERARLLIRPALSQNQRTLERVERLLEKN